MDGESPLNAGAPARKRSSLRKFSLWAGAILVGLFVARFIVTIGQSFFHFAQFSHSRVFQNQTLEEVKNRAAVVRPLIDGSQTFDIAVSIWTLPTEENGAERIGDVVETPLYSNIVFRGLRLSDKNKAEVLTYKLPVAVYRRLLLKENDLRASFVAIPTSPSLLDYVTDFSTWRPETMRVPPVRSWPFPLGASSSGLPNVIDRALDSFGISIPLLEFHEIRSKCANGSDSKISQLSNQKVNDEDYDDEEDPEDEADGNDDDTWGVSNIAKNPQHAVKRHPFVVTRTQIRVVDETHIFNRKAYNKEHNKLRTTSCGQGLNAMPDNNLCHRLYYSNGNWETRLELRIPDEVTGELRTEWAYAPYIGHAEFSSGPKDIILVPVTRENCAQSENESSSDPDFIEVNWQLSYSGRTPAKYVATELFARPQRVDHLDSDYKKAKAHDSAELWNGLYGHRFYDDAHPRRRFIIGSLASIVSFVLAVLEIGYWYTRTSTVSISVSGTVLVALSGIIAAFAHVANTAETDKLNTLTSHWIQWLWLIVLTLATKLSLPWFMLKAVTRFEFSRNNSNWYPSVRRVGATHKERNSQRLDSRTTWGVKAGVCISLIAIYYLFSPDEYHVISTNLPDPSPGDHPINIIARVYGLLFFPLKFTGQLSQLLLNQRTKTFAGSYKMAIVLRSILLALDLIVYSPSVVGRFDARPGFSAPQVVDMLALAALIWQAATLPKVMQEKEDEDSE
ncbi:hypothetical protein C8R44DRAFT_788507 [Mycena epipterygia]|nr:hypothetical protein C8R44DRAFT_788507 [Mycena epipterygia]